MVVNINRHVIVLMVVLLLGPNTIFGSTSTSASVAPGTSGATTATVAGATATTTAAAATSTAGSGVTTTAPAAPTATTTSSGAAVTSSAPGSATQVSSSASSGTGVTTASATGTGSSSAADTGTSVSSGGNVTTPSSVSGTTTAQSGGASPESKDYITDTELAIIVSVAVGMFVLLLAVMVLWVYVLSRLNKARRLEKSRMYSKRRLHRRRREPFYDDDDMYDDIERSDEVYIPVRGRPMYSNMLSIAPASEPYNVLPVIPEANASDSVTPYNPYLYDDRKSRTPQTRLVTLGGQIHDNFRPYRSSYAVNELRASPSVWHSSAPQLRFNMPRAWI